MWPFNRRRKDTDRPLVVPPVDLDVPVTNSLLKTALAERMQGFSPEKERSLVHALATANYLVVILTDEMKVTPASVPGQATIGAGSRIKFLCCSNAKNESILPAFTDWDEIKAWTKEDVGTLVMPASQLWDFVLKNYAGVVINPAGNALELGREALLQLRNARGQK